MPVVKHPSVSLRTQGTPSLGITHVYSLRTKQGINDHKTLRCLVFPRTPRVKRNGEPIPYEN